MDALQSFVFLKDNLPIWISKLRELSRQVAERHAEFTRLSQTSSLDSFRRKRTGSTESLRPNDTPTHEKSAFAIPEVPASPARIEINPSSKHLFKEYREEKLRRKRKSGSILSGASGPQKFRSRMSAIVYYDSAIQEGFEMLVRQISGARNNLRKGKTAASFKARLASLQMEESPFGGEGSIQLRNPNIPRLPKCRNGPYITETNANEAFDQADKHLETAQSFCEVGAHQFLRDGNCAEEIAATKERFESCLLVVKQQAAILQAEEQKEKEEEERRKQYLARQENQEHAQPMEVDKVEPSVQVDVEVEQLIAKSPGTNLPSGMLGVDTIEVDDASDTSSIHIDLTAFRSTRREPPR